MEDISNTVGNWVWLLGIVTLTTVTARNMWCERYQIRLVMPYLRTKRRHGVMWMPASDGRRLPYSFIVDRPELLVNPRLWVLRELVRQARQQGYNPIQLDVEILSQSRHYRIEDGEPRLLGSIATFG